MSSKWTWVAVGAAVSAAAAVSAVVDCIVSTLGHSCGRWESAQRRRLDSLYWEGGMLVIRSQEPGVHQKQAPAVF